MERTKAYFLDELLKGALNAIFRLGASFDEEHAVFACKLQSFLPAHFASVLRFFFYFMTVLNLIDFSSGELPCLSCFLLAF